jgi:hypothetical protein
MSDFDDSVLANLIDVNLPRGDLPLGKRVHVTHNLHLTRKARSLIIHSRNRANGAQWDVVEVLL